MNSRHGSENSNWKGGRVEGPDGRTMVYSPDYKGPKVAGVYVLEYRLIAEKKIGRMLFKGEIVHHINGDKTDNRPENLEIMTQSQHMAEHHGQMLAARLVVKKRPVNSIRNKSGFQGVSWDKSNGKWVSRIGINRKTINLGRFDTAEEASKAYVAENLKHQEKKHDPD